MAPVIGGQVASSVSSSSADSTVSPSSPLSSFFPSIPSVSSSLPQYHAAGVTSGPMSQSAVDKFIEQNSDSWLASDELELRAHASPRPSVSVVTPSNEFTLADVIPAELYKLSDKAYKVYSSIEAHVEVFVEPGIKPGVHNSTREHLVIEFDEGYASDETTKVPCVWTRRSSASSWMKLCVGVNVPSDVPENSHRATIAHNTTTFRQFVDRRYIVMAYN